MLSREALDSSLPLVERLDTNNIILRPVPGTHLDKLNRATRATSLFNVQLGNGEIMPDVANIEYIANTKNETLGYSDHDIEMDDLSEVCANAVRDHIAFARTTVMPAILDLVDKFKTAQKASASVSAMLGLEVVVWDAPTPLVNLSFAESMADYENVTFTDPRFAFRLPAQSYEELVVLMHTGKASVDEDIRGWAAAKGAGFFLDIWAQFFQGMDTGNRTFFDLTSNPQNGPDTALAVFLLARRLVEDPPENSGMGLEQYRNAMVDFRDQAALRLCVFLTDLRRDESMGRLIRSINGKVTIVNGSIYKNWIEAGGSNEILLGNMLSNSPLYLTELINAAAKDLLAFWHRHETATIINEKRNSFNRNVAILRKAFAAQLHELTDPNEANQANLTVVQRLFNDEVGRVREEDFGNVMRLCLRMVCRTRFYQTDAEFILESSERIKADFPNIDVREAMAMATLEYIVRWVLTQMKPDSV